MNYIKSLREILHKHKSPYLSYTWSFACDYYYIFHNGCSYNYIGNISQGKIFRIGNHDLFNQILRIIKENINETIY
jgi:hypothetical protein